MEGLVGGQCQADETSLSDLELSEDLLLTKVLDELHIQGGGSPSGWAKWSC